ncbi:MAG: hypothetical protein PHC83_06270 [Bacteroidales bacterium]|nr:hypothetical protein [Bacteroidales bacterium]MDD3281159.1 hypothetical protein [Bacteroidales bacterium]MDD4210170.1 hypothetical protein [Bacteroidales bacterium]
MKKVKIIVAAILVVAVGAGIFWACKKEFENNKIENKIKLHKSNGNSVREKASSLSVGYSGLIYDKDCLTNNNVSDYKSNAKKDHILLDDGIGRPFRVQYEGISSFYSVTKTNCSSISNTLGLKLHKKNC